MSDSHAAAQLFDHWATGDRARPMWQNHLPRVRQVWQMIPNSDGNYLEVGCGCGLGLRHIAANQYRDGQCVGIDVSEGMIRLARETTAGLGNVRLEAADFINWEPGEGLTFDAIFSMEVFYYFSSIQEGLDHAARLLAPGGWLWVLVDLYHENAASHDWSERLGVPMQMWSKARYADGFAKAGLSEVRQIILHNPNDGGASEAPTLCTWGRRLQ
ncbi:class I SAM-dependent methyltransferase [Kiritimatiella glycovorans]|uniref:Demethylrebeccamycin-D-glucose O-methyltransferase n=1 Tax=Kiritimatiella glycovorans TaxID=1307763 RepID=A0A0G3EEU7_9BACT|nr:class I SAM-dependent methyltransferase [Kiritimatiella glycovorans]AKJ64828.1 Demethylrebeccamycin-D-glucose O-methyltransferase [Kiritimatiella glycovorans]